MIDNKIMYETVERLHESFSASISICDVSGRIVVSTGSSCIGEMNLFAIEALNINSKITVFMDSKIQKAGAATSLRFQKSRVGAVVLQGAGSSGSRLAELLSETIELSYEELVLSKKEQDRTQERNQFLYEWLHLQSDYTENFIKQGGHLGIDITRDRTITLIERKQGDLSTSTSITQNLLDDRDVLLPLSRDQDLIILKENGHFEKGYNHVIATGRSCHTGIYSGSAHPHTAYQVVLESLKLGEILFPDEHLYCFEKMKLAIALSKTPIPGLKDPFPLLVVKGRNAQLADTAITCIRLNGDIQKICDKLHIHRSDIPYRIRRIHKICGCSLMDYYDMLYLYASFVRYTGKGADIQQRERQRQVLDRHYGEHYGSSSSMSFTRPIDFFVVDDASFHDGTPIPKETNRGGPKGGVITSPGQLRVMSLLFRLMPSPTLTIR